MSGPVLDPMIEKQCQDTIKCCHCRAKQAIVELYATSDIR